MNPFSVHTTLPIVRTHKIDDQTIAAMAKLSKVFPTQPLVVLNGSTPSKSLTGCQVVNLSERDPKRWGLKNIPGNWGWFCGDFCYYRANDLMRGFDHYLIVEQDVHFCDEALQIFARELVARGSFHAAAAQLSASFEKPPKFSRDLSALGRSDRVGCIFSITVASRSQVENMKELRLNSDEKGLSLNDEAIFASVAFEEDGASLNLSIEMPDLFHHSTFYTNPSHLYEGINADERKAFWHPVVTLDLVERRIQSGEKNYSAHRLRKVLREAPPGLKKEITRALSQTTQTLPASETLF